MAVCAVGQLFQQERSRLVHSCKGEKAEKKENEQAKRGARAVT